MATPFSVILIIFVAIAFISSLFQKFSKKGTSPPGPWKLPLIGNLHQMVGGLAHHILRDMSRKHGPIFSLQLGEVSTIIISSPRLAKEVLKTHCTVFAGRQQIMLFKVIYYDSNSIITGTYDDNWKQMRKICDHELLNAKTVRSLLPVRMEEGEHLISMARNSVSKYFNFTEAISYYTISVVSRFVFGRICIDKDEFIKLLTEIVCLTSGLDIADLFPSLKFLNSLSGMMPKLLKVHKRLDSLLDDMINEHICSTKNCNGVGGEEDAIDILLRVKDSGNLKLPISDIQIKAMITDMFLAGTETSATATVWAMTELIRNPRVMAKAQSELRQAFRGNKSLDEAAIFELNYLNFVVKETLRLHPPAPLLVPRECLEDCVIDEYVIPSKTRVIINDWAIGRDPDNWSDPESFIPERFEDSKIDFMGNHFELLPFGAGKRICPGIATGLANVKLPLALLLYHFDWEGLKPENVDITEILGGTCRRKLDLCMIPTLPSTSPDGQ